MTLDEEARDLAERLEYVAMRVDRDEHRRLVETARDLLVRLADENAVAQHALGLAATDVCAEWGWGTGLEVVAREIRRYLDRAESALASVRPGQEQDETI